VKGVKNMSEFRGMLLETIQGLQAGTTDYKVAKGTASLASCVLNSVKLELMMIRQFGAEGNAPAAVNGKPATKKLKASKPAESAQIKLVA
jgi:hypothetical protein